MLIAVGNCELYNGPWGGRVGDIGVVHIEGLRILTDYPRQLERSI